jgi:hypothetical protein
MSITRCPHSNCRSADRDFWNLRHNTRHFKQPRGGFEIKHIMTNITHFSLKNVITWLKTSPHYYTLAGLHCGLPSEESKSLAPQTRVSHPFSPPKRNSYLRKRTQSYEAVASARRLLQYCQLPAIATGWKVRGSNPVRGEIFRTRPDQPWTHPASYTMSNGSLSRG